MDKEILDKTFDALRQQVKEELREWGTTKDLDKLKNAIVKANSMDFEEEAEMGERLMEKLKKERDSSSPAA